MELRYRRSNIGCAEGRNMEHHEWCLDKGDAKSTRFDHGMDSAGGADRGDDKALRADSQEGVD